MKAFFPGSFNPFTIGHLDIMVRAKPFFPEIVVGIGYNERKHSPEDAEILLENIGNLLRDIPGITVCAYSGLTARAAKEAGADLLIRGVRNAADADYERSMADANRHLFGLETLLIPCRPELSFISSSMVRELEHNGVDISQFLPSRKDCETALRNDEVRDT